MEHVLIEVWKILLLFGLSLVISTTSQYAWLPCNDPLQCNDLKGHICAPCAFFRSDRFARPGLDDPTQELVEDTSEFLVDSAFADRQRPMRAHSTKSLHEMAHYDTYKSLLFHSRFFFQSKHTLMNLQCLAPTLPYKIWTSDSSLSMTVLSSSLASYSTMCFIQVHATRRRSRKFGYGPGLL